MIYIYIEREIFPTEMKGLKNVKNIGGDGIDVSATARANSYVY